MEGPTVHIYQKMYKNISNQPFQPRNIGWYDKILIQCDSHYFIVLLCDSQLFIYQNHWMVPQTSFQMQPMAANHNEITHTQG